MKIWAEKVGFASKTWKIGSFGFAIVRLSFGYRSLSFTYRLQSFAIVRYRSLIVRYRSPIVSLSFTYRSPIVHLSFANRSPSFTKFPAFVRLQFVTVPVSAIFAIRFSTTPQNMDFPKKKIKRQNQLTQPRLPLNPMKLGLHTPSVTNLSVNCCELFASCT